MIHIAGFESTGVDWTYVALPVSPVNQERIVSACSALGIAGLSVTMPYKTAVTVQVDEIDDTCRRLGSVNTVSFSDDQRSKGHTTDGDGLVLSLAHDGVDVSDLTVLVIGTGGAGRSVLEAISRRGPRRLLAANRSADRPDLTSVSANFERVDWTDRNEAAGAADIVVNCTSVGMGSDRSTPIDTSCIGPRHTIVDLVYHPMETRLLGEATARGARSIGGLGMLVHQAALQQKIWTGHMPDVEVMSQAARSALLAQG